MPTIKLVGYSTKGTITKNPKDVVVFKDIKTNIRFAPSAGWLYTRTGRYALAINPDTKKYMGKANGVPVQVAVRQLRGELMW